MSIPTFAGGTLDRAGPRRTDTPWQVTAREDPGARVIVVGRDGVGVTTGRAGTDAIFLGTEDGGPVFARAADSKLDGAVPLEELRVAAARLDAAEAGLLAYAAAIVSWHHATAFCGRCGAQTQVGEAGHVRTCSNGHAHHPRTDPVVITLVVDREGDRLLLGRQPGFPDRRYSTLSGFVEPGESLEHAVAREAQEEAGVLVRDVRYVCSQPWPYPMNLMVGFEADWGGGEARIVDRELESVRWFNRDEITIAAGDDEPWPAHGEPPPARTPGDLVLPPSLSIARTLIENWLQRS